MLQGHIGVVRCIHLMEDRLVSAGDCKRVMVWNAKVSKVLISLLLYGVLSLLFAVEWQTTPHSPQAANQSTFAVGRQHTYCDYPT